MTLSVRLPGIERIHFAQSQATDLADLELSPEPSQAPIYDFLAFECGTKMVL